MPPGFSGVDVGRMADVMLPFAAEPLLQGRESVLQSVGQSWLDDDGAPQARADHRARERGAAGRAAADS